MFLEQNIKSICEKQGVNYADFLEQSGVGSADELSLIELNAFCESSEIDLHALLFKPMFKTDAIREKIQNIKLLILDVDGVMTDGGMYFTESGDQFKKYNTKDGMPSISARFFTMLDLNPAEIIPT